MEELFKLDTDHVQRFELNIIFDMLSSEVNDQLISEVNNNTQVTEVLHLF